MKNIYLSPVDKYKGITSVDNAELFTVSMVDIFQTDLM